MFESPDEPHHWQYTRYLHDEWRLPFYDASFVEANSPPLYYLLVAPIAHDTELPPHLAWVGGDGALTIPYAPRFYLNAGDDLRRYWPIRASRLLTALLTACAIVYVFRSGCALGGTCSAGLLAAAFVAFLPQFAFRAGTISNDSVLVTCSAALTFYVIKALRGRTSGQEGLWTGLWLAAAYLTKINAICLVAAVVLAAMFSKAGIRQRISWCFAALITALLAVLPWSLRNVFLYGDLFASGAMRTAVSSLIVDNPITSPYFYTIFPYALMRSFVGVFGWMNVWLPETMYRLFGLIVLVGLAGVGFELVRRRDSRRAVLVLSVIVLGALAVTVHINRTFHQPQGRYLFPALPALGLLWGIGVSRLIGNRRWTMLTAWGITTILGLFNATALLRYVIPAYYPPVMPALTKSVAQLPYASFAYGLQAVSDGWLEVTNSDPQIAFTTSIHAEDFGFLEFEIEGHHANALVTGSAFFAGGDGQGSPAHRLGFTWKADGQRRKIIVPMLKNSLWRGRVTTVRIDPLDPPAESDLGRRLRISAVQLRSVPRS